MILFTITAFVITCMLMLGAFSLFGEVGFDLPATIAERSSQLDEDAQYEYDLAQGFDVFIPDYTPRQYYQARTRVSWHGWRAHRAFYGV